ATASPSSSISEPSPACQPATGAGRGCKSHRYAGCREIPQRGASEVVHGPFSARVDPFPTGHWVPARIGRGSLADSPRETRQVRRTSSGADVPGRRPSLDARLLARSWERNARIRALGSQPPPCCRPPRLMGGAGSGQAIRGIRLAILRQPVWVVFSPHLAGGARGLKSPGL